MRSRGVLREAPVTKILIAVCVAIAVIQMLTGPRLSGFLDSWLGLTELGLRAGFWWQPVTYMFLHDSSSALPLHLLVNMVGLWFAGREVEFSFGRARYLATYFMGGILGGLFQVWMTADLNAPLIGASAGVCAVLLAFTAIYPNLPITALLFFVIPLRIKAKYLGYLVLGTSVILGASNWQPGVGHFAHLGGAMVGLIAARFLGFGKGFFPQFSFLRRKKSDGFSLVPPDSSQLDAILSKVSRHGLHTLTPDERDLLERWSRRGRR